MTRVYLYLIVLVVSLGISFSASADSFHWSAPAEAVDEHRLYRSYTSLSSEHMWTALGTDTTITIENSAAIAFFSLTAYRESEPEGEKESARTHEIAIKYCNGVRCQADFEVSTTSDSAFVTWEVLDSIDDYLLKYKEENDSTYTLETISGGNHVLTLAPGTYEFSLFIINAEGKTINNTSAEPGSIYTKQQAIVQVTPPPSPPNYKVEAFGADGIAGWNQTLMIAFDEVDPSIEYYRVDVFNSSALAIAGGNGNIISNALVPYGSNFCQTINTANYPILFFTVSAIDYDGREGNSYVGYKLIGNVTETDNDGVAFGLSAVNIDDYNILRLYYFKPFTHRSNNYCGENNLYNILPFSYQERMDYNLDGIVRGAEYNFFRAVYGRTGAGY